MNHPNNEDPSYGGYPESMDAGGGVGYVGVDGSYSYGDHHGGEYYYNEHQQQAMYNPYQQQQYEEYGLTSSGGWDKKSRTKRGDYFYSSEFAPQVYDHAISALAYDPTYECMYLASTTQSMSSARHNKAKNHRASLLLTYSYTNPVKEYFLYSSVAGHPEASLSILRVIYESIYGISKVGLSATAGVQQRGARNSFYPPPHAYTPAYGGGEIVENHLSAYHNPHAPHQEQQHHQRGHMGINDLLPLDGGYVASVSPSAVRIHSHGGLQVHDTDICGMISGTIHPNCSSGILNDAKGNAAATHVTVGGMPMKKAGGDGAENAENIAFRKNTRVIHPSIHCLDLWQGLRAVVSRSFKATNHDQNGYHGNSQLGVTCLSTSHERGSIVAGCTDGNIRLFDGSLRELATIRSHLGGVSSIAVSPDGNLIATTGYSSRANPNNRTEMAASCSALYAYPDPTIYVYDIRYLGRGGVSHPFSGMKGAPRHICFVPDVEGCASNRFLVASGKSGGGIQVITPFETQNEATISFDLPPLQQGESITTMSQPEQDTGELAIGTSMGRVIEYSLSSYNSKTLRKKESLVMPPFYPDPPAVSMEPSLLQGNPGLRNGSTDELRSLFGTYILQAFPRITSIGDSFEDAMESFGSLAKIPISIDQRRNVNPILLKDAITGEKDYMLTVPVSKLDIDLLSNQSSVSKNYKGKKKRKSILNPNKLIYSDILSSLCYEAGWNGKGKQTQQHSRGQRSSIASSKQKGIPPRYQLQVRPDFKASRAFDPSQYNDTGLFPGWDYNISMPNAWVSPVLLLFYFIPEVRATVLEAQFNDEVLGTRSYEKALSPELGFLFHQVESLSRFGLLYPTTESSNTKDRTQGSKIGAWIPSNFLTFLSTMGEAEQMAVLDDSPAAVDLPRRPESFYRFLAYQLDKELCSSSTSLLSSTSPRVKSFVSETKIMDSLNGLDFLSSNQFIESKSTPPTQSMTRALTLDLNYDIFRPGAKRKPIRFGELLQHSLCRSTRLRAWNDRSRAYETIVQRKIVTSLPQILTLSCACAGRKEQDGLWAWRTDAYGGEPWLAEMIEVELLEDGNVAVTEWHKAKDESGETSSTYRGKSSLPPEVAKLVLKASSKQKFRYRLEAVLSYVTGCEDEDEPMGHHVLHSRVSSDYRRRVLESQAREARKLAEKDLHNLRENCEFRDLLLSAGTTADDCIRRAKIVEEQLSRMKKEQGKTILSDDWIIYNSYKVSKTVVEDARAFHVPFKEPVLVVFQAIDENGAALRETSDLDCDVKEITQSLATSVMNPSSLSSHSGKILTTECIKKFKNGNPFAFDAEFVSVQEEESTVTDTGQKEILRDTRHALGRISIFDCLTEETIVDDHVLPREQVVDFLTRFSGIVAEDLDVVRSRHRIISSRSAYLQLRYLLDQGCIFVGHGLKQDFSTVNLVVPPNQILDTVKIFHIPGRRYVSLRFLANFVFGRDMQQDTHDSVEDARAAYELYCKALDWKKDGIWEKKLLELYAYGEKTSWKLGMKDRF